MQSRHECFLSCAAFGTAGLCQTLTAPPACVLPSFRARTVVSALAFCVGGVASFETRGGARRDSTQSVSLSGVRLVDGWVLSNPDLCARVRVAAVISTHTVAPVLAFCVGCGVGSFDPRAARYVTWRRSVFFWLVGYDHLKPSQTRMCVPVSCATVLLSSRDTDPSWPAGA